MSEELVSIISEFGEYGLDNFLDSGLLKDLPIVGPFFSIIKLSNGIQDRIFVEKIKLFIENIEENSKWKKKFSNDDECQKISKNLVYIINSSDDDEKIKLIAHIFNNFVKGKIRKDMFLYLTNIVSKSYYPHLKLLKDIANDRFVNDGKKYDISVIYHLQSIGVFDYSSSTMNLISAGKIVKPAAIIVKISAYGEVLKTIIEEIEKKKAENI